MRWNRPLVGALRHVKHRGQLVRFQFIRAEDAEGMRVTQDDIAQIPGQHLRTADKAIFFRASLACRNLLNTNCILENIRKIKVSTYPAAEGVRVTAHAAITLWTLFENLWLRAALFIEELFDVVGT